MASYGVDGYSRGSVEKIEHLLNKAKKCKEEANKKYQAKEIRPAIRLYHQALLYLKSITQGQDSVGSVLGVTSRDALPAEIQAHITKLTSDCHNNLAACLIQGDNPDYLKIISYCDLALAAQPTNHKAHFRRGICLYELKDYEKALKCFNSAKEHMDSPTDPKVKQYVDLCYKAMRSEDEKLKTAYRNMFKTNIETSSKANTQPSP